MYESVLGNSQDLASDNFKKKERLVLGIESSCDETAIGLYSSIRGICANKIFSQEEFFKIYKGVVPEIAARLHLEKIFTLLRDIFEEEDLKSRRLDAIGYTKGPGLISALFVGTVVAKTLGMAINIPVIPVNHLKAHILVVLALENRPKFPFLALLVSGGNTLLALVKDIGEIYLLGETLDDAVGEAFDKTGKILGFNYPGGKEIEKAAAQARRIIPGFPEPLTKEEGNLDFSFSGLKTHVRRISMDDDRDEIARSFQEAAIAVLVKKSSWAIKKTGIDRLVIVGGVSVNQELRSQFQKKLGKQVDLYFLPASLCGDNGAMVAFTAWLYFNRGLVVGEELRIEPFSRWPIERLE